MVCRPLCTSGGHSRILFLPFTGHIFAGMKGAEELLSFQDLFLTFLLLFLTIFVIVCTVVVPRFVRDRVCARRLVSL